MGNNEIDGHGLCAPDTNPLDNKVLKLSFQKRPPDTAGEQFRAVSTRLDMCRNQTDHSKAFSCHRLRISPVGPDVPAQNHRDNLCLHEEV